MNMVYVSALIASLIAGFLLTALMRYIAFKYNILDIPHGSLKVHKRPTPYLGGVAVYGGIIIGLVLHFSDAVLFFPAYLWIFFGITGMLLLGLYDDIFMISPAQKFLGQAFCTMLLLHAGSLSKTVFLSHPLWYAISFFFIMSLVNAFNLVDVMDGLATTIAITSLSSFFCIALMQGAYEYSLILLIVIGALVGFFCWNRPVARIYLGDAGALLIGTIVAIAPFFLSWSHETTWGFLTPLAIVGIPLLEVFCLIVIRLALSIPPYQGSPHHFSIFLQKKGWSKWQILFWTMGNGILLSGLGFCLMQKIISPALFFLIGFFFLLQWIYVVFDALVVQIKKSRILCQQ